MRLGGNASVAARRLAYMPAKRCAEGARGAVADAFGDLIDSKIVAAEQVLRDGHAPGKEVFHRRQPHGARKAMGIVLLRLCFSARNRVSSSS